MENASKALLIAGGVLIAILIITLAVRLFLGTGNVSRSYNSQIKIEEIAMFNNNFTQYLDKKITIHEAITITNFAKSNGVVVNNPKETKDIDNTNAKEKKYEIVINEDNYDDNGYIKSITIKENL